MADLPKPPDGSGNVPPKFEKALRRFLQAQGFSEAAIEEIFKGNPIQLVKATFPTPWPRDSKREFVFKDGEIQEIPPDEEPKLPRP